MFYKMSIENSTAYSLLVTSRLYGSTGCSISHWPK